MIEERSLIEKNNRSFILIAGVCALLSAITTIGIHWFFSYPEMDFNERLQLAYNSTYIFNRWWIIFHCLFVLVSMWGFFIVQFKKSKGFVGLGFLFYSVFALTEILRQFLVLYYLNGLRIKYLNTSDIDLQAILSTQMDGFYLINDTLFVIFILAFGLGNLFYGLSLMKEIKFSKILGFLLILWFLINLIAFLNDSWNSASLGNVIEFLSLTFQPLMRVFIGLWLISSVKKISIIKTHNQ